jgi:PAS domain S-box-containing protein
LIWAKNLNHEYIFANKALCYQLLMAESVEEPIGKTDAYFKEREQMKHPDDPNWFTFGDLFPNSDEIVLHNKRYQTFEEHGTIQGEQVWFDVHKAPLVDDSGEIIGTVGSARNVTLQKVLEEERKSEARIKNVVYRISNAIRTTKDLSELYTVIRLELGQVINTTNMYIALYDQRRDHLSLPYFVDENDRFSSIPGTNTLTHYLLKRNKPMLLREADFSRLASEKSIEITGTPAKVWLGVPLHINEEISGAIVLQNYKDPYAFTDQDLELLEFVSSQISISINHKQADDALRENEFMLREIIDSVPLMVFAKDRNQRFVLANKTFAKAYDKQVGEIEGKMQSEIHPVTAEVDKFNRDDRLLLDQKSKRIETEEIFTLYNGERRFLRTVKVPLNPEAEKGIALLGVAMDITDAKEHEIEMKKAKERAEESDRLKTAFLANMSHEIRTPMNAIIGFSELLNDPQITDSTRREFVNLIGENSKVLLNLIEDIIDVAKIEAQQVKIVQTTCQVNSILDELKDLYEKQLRKYPHKNIRINLAKAIDDEGFLIVTDPLRLRQVLNNMIGNAIKFTDQGEVSFGYSFSDDHTLQFYVRDTGIGLADEKKTLIFERFRQVEESSTKEYGGTGLGLTISKRLVEMLGGSIWVDSKLNEGSTFYFTIPFKPVKERLETKLFNRQSDKQNWSGKTVLVAEDEASNFELIKATLQRTQVRIIRAMNGQEAVDLCMNGKQSIDLILMDIRMPVMNGYEATRRIKKADKTIPVISLTAYAMSDDREKSFRAGCDEYVSKPFNPADLLEKMSRFLH